MPRAVECRSSECDAGRKAIQRAALQRRIATSLTFTSYTLTVYKACCGAHSFEKSRKVDKVVETIVGPDYSLGRLGNSCHCVTCTPAQMGTTTRQPVLSAVRWSRTRGVVRIRSSCSCPDGRCGVGFLAVPEPQTTFTWRTISRRP